ncbi:MAG: TVP38/TMEM64 family protein [Acidisphaera sp.]|nr:TVP38/TMEM64 family protein [Acidisphaera sp.]
MTRLARLWPLLLLAAALALAYAAGLRHQLSWHALAAHETDLRAALRAHPLAVPAAYVGLYILITVLSLPGGVVLDIAGGLLFGTVLSAGLTVFGATVGAVLLFLIARRALAGVLAVKAGPFIARLRPGLERDGFSYLLAIRLVPIFPFWLVNLAPALLGMRLGPYALATLLGILPACVIFASIGAGLGGVISAGQPPDLRVIFAPPVLLPLLGLAALSLLPVAWRHLRPRHA